MRILGCVTQPTDGKEVGWVTHPKIRILVAPTILLVKRPDTPWTLGKTAVDLNSVMECFLGARSLDLLCKERTII